jgi:transcriptional regulatory protein LevR
VVLPWSAEQLIREVDEIFARAEAQLDLQVQSDYAKYLIIRVSGLVEQVVTEVILTYVATQASQPVSAHVSWRMGRFKIRALSASFNLPGPLIGTDALF